MNTNKTQVKVLIPIYRSSLSELERKSLANTCQVLAAYPIVIVKPASVQAEELRKDFPQVQLMDVSDEWLGKKNGVQGYNQMMLSSHFYELFLDVDYIFICHLDAWVFSDQLGYWCAKGYDHIAPTWPLPPRYRHFPFRQWLRLKKKLTPADKIKRFRTFDKIGNGGFSLRRVSVFLDACKSYAPEIEQFNSQFDSLHNEDIFWALVPQQFNLPSVSEAIQFGFDVKPALCFQLNGYQLPIGCHGVHKEQYRAFWQQYIPALAEEVNKKQE